MAQINFAKGEVQCKIVYYGPAESGKTENLRAIFAGTPEHIRGQLTSIATDANRTLFFDYLPLNLGKVASIRTKLNLYAVPFTEGHDALRVLVLEGADGIVFVADARKSRLEANRDAVVALKSDLGKIGRDIGEIPFVFQANKMDMEDAVPAAKLAEALSLDDISAHDARADEGTGTMATLKAISHQVLKRVSSMMNAPGARAAVEAATPVPEPAPAPEPEAEIELAETAEEPAYIPAWHRNEGDETATGRMSSPPAESRQQVRHTPIAGIQGNESFDHSDTAPEQPAPRSAAQRETAQRETPPDSSTDPAEFIADLKKSVQESENSAQWEDAPGTDPFMRPSEAPQPFPAFGGGMAPATDSAGGQGSARFVAVGKGGSRGRVRTRATSELRWGIEDDTKRDTRRGSAPRIERRGRPRAQWRAAPPAASRMALGAAVALLWLAATGFMVHTFL